MLKLLKLEYFKRLKEIMKKMEILKIGILDESLESRGFNNFFFTFFELTLSVVTNSVKCRQKFRVCYK